MTGPSKIDRLSRAQPNAHRLAPIDLRILDELRVNARLPNKDLAARVGIAPSTCHGRVRALERSGVIIGYRAVVDLAACGIPVRALVFARVGSAARPRMLAIAQGLRDADEVVEVFVVGGEEDLLIHVVCATTMRLRDFVNDRLGNDPDIASTRTSIVFDHFDAVG